jgi:hypothetical protein
VFWPLAISLLWPITYGILKWTMERALCALGCFHFDTRFYYQKEYLIRSLETVATQIVPFLADRTTEHRAERNNMNS